MRKKIAFMFVQTMMAFCAVAHSTNRTLNLKNFGAAGDGVSDDTVALMQWLAAAQPGYCLYAPTGTYAFSSPLSIGLQGIAIVGAGPYQTVFKYVGASSTVDLLHIGSPLGGIENVFLQGFKIQSTTQMTEGAGLHLQGVSRSQLRDIVADGQDGNGFLCHGIWFDKVDVTRLDNFEARSSQDAIRINGAVGSGPKSDLFMRGGKICLSNVGIHVGGAFGGLIVDDTDVIENNTNVLVDTALANEANRELFFNSGCLSDDALVVDNYLINDSLVGGGTLYIGGWASSSIHNSIHVEHWNGIISIDSPTVYNCQGDGIRVEDPASTIAIGSNTFIRYNGGYGVNATIPTDTITPGSLPVGNTLGSYAPNTHIDFESSGSGYHKFANGRIVQWLTTTVTGPANALLLANGGSPIALPIAFPNQMDVNTLTARPYGFANGAMSLNATASPFSNSGVFVSLVASGAVTDPQTIQVTVWGR
jgi:Pectate lyase superfamily protein